MAQRSIMFDTADPQSGDQFTLPGGAKKHRNRLTPELMKAIMKIESGGNPNARTGSYKGLYQLSDGEFKRLGGVGDIFNPKENERIAALKLQNEADQVSAKLGRELTPGEIYLVHQQGVGGATEHLTNPDRPAWQSMNATAEGRSKGAGWSRLAIWGNVPDQDKARYGNVDNLTSGEFAKMWSDRVERGTGGDSRSGSTTVTPPPLDPTPNVGSGASDYEPPTLADSKAKVDEETKKKSYGEIFGETLADIGKSMAEGPIAKGATKGSVSANAALPVPITPAAPSPLFSNQQAEAQRQQLAMMLQRLNAGRLA